MKKELKGMSLLMLTAALTVVTACSNNNGAGEAGNVKNEDPASTTNVSEVKTPDPGTLKVSLFGEKPIDMDKVVAEFENKTKGTLNTSLDITFDLPDQYSNKLSLKLSAGEEFDLAFDAPWWNMNQNISKGYYQELDKYFNNDEYPGLKAAFSEEYLENNKINGHIYAIPVTNFYTDIPILLIRKDLREKYGLEPIKSYDDLKIFFDKVKENNPEMDPFGGGRMVYYQMFTNFADKQETYRAYPYEVTGTAAQFNIVLSDDGKKVLGATTIGDPEADYANFPAPYNTSEFFYSHLDKRVEYSKYLPKDPLAEKSAGAPLAAAYESTLNGFANSSQQLKQQDPNASYEAFVYNEAAMNKQDAAIGTSFKAWNFLVVPKTSKNTDRVMKYLDWLFSNPDNHDLFELGIEGEHWIKGEEGQYSTTDKTQNYVFPGYEMTWNPILSRVNGQNDPAVLDYINYQAKNEAYYQLALSGFTFNSESVKSEVAKVQTKFDTANLFYLAGQDANWRKSAAKFNKELKSLGLEKIRAELVKQVQEYLDNGGK
jgi:hypothetical protein